jgi:hypothetical protein
VVWLEGIRLNGERRKYQTLLPKLTITWFLMERFGVLFGLLPHEDREGHFAPTINAPKQASLCWMYFGLNIRA